jgi:hypothetical protein
LHARYRLDAESGEERILFVYQEVLQKELAWLENIMRAKAAERPPVVLTSAERA